MGVILLILFLDRGTKGKQTRQQNTKDLALSDLHLLLRHADGVGSALDVQTVLELAAT